MSSLLDMFVDDGDVERSCRSKNAYDSEYQAKFAADEQMSFHRGLRLSWYRCRYCGKWHLTKSLKQDNTYRRDYDIR